MGCSGGKSASVGGRSSKYTSSLPETFVHPSEAFSPAFHFWRASISSCSQFAKASVTCAESSAGADQSTGTSWAGPCPTDEVLVSGLLIVLRFFVFCPVLVQLARQLCRHEGQPESQQSQRQNQRSLVICVAADAGQEVECRSVVLLGYDCALTVYHNGVLTSRQPVEWGLAAGAWPGAEHTVGYHFADNVVR